MWLRFVLAEFLEILLNLLPLLLDPLLLLNKHHLLFLVTVKGEALDLLPLCLGRVSFSIRSPSYHAARKARAGEVL